MADFDWPYDEDAALADELIGETGRTITLVQSSATPADVSRPWLGSSAPHTEASPGASVTAIGVFVNQADQDNFGYGEADTEGTLLKRGQKRCLVAATQLSPDTDVSRFDAILDGTQIWRIVDVNILEPGGVRIMYDFTLEQ